MNALDSSMLAQHKITHYKLSPVEQAYLVGQHDAGKSFGQVSQETGVPKSIVTDSIKNTNE